MRAEGTNNCRRSAFSHAENVCVANLNNLTRIYQRDPGIAFRLNSHSPGAPGNYRVVIPSGNVSWLIEVPSRIWIATAMLLAGTATAQGAQPDAPSDKVIGKLRLIDKAKKLAQVVGVVLAQPHGGKWAEIMPWLAHMASYEETMPVWPMSPAVSRVTGMAARQGALGGPCDSANR